VADDRLVPGLAATAPARRALLIASVAALPAVLAACRGVQALGTPPAPPADVDTLRDAIEHETALVTSYAAAAAGGPLAPVLAVVLADHRQHLAQLSSRLIEPAAHGSATPTPAAGGRGVIMTVAQLEQAEQAASDRLIAQLAGLPPVLAQLFASIAASEATHVPYLRAAGQGR
jgi:hypothetical protein